MAAPYAGVICPVHGHVDIDRDTYIWEMNRPNSRWMCPKCGSVSDFDGDRYEELNPEPEEE